MRTISRLIAGVIGIWLQGGAAKADPANADAAQADGAQLPSCKVIPTGALGRDDKDVELLNALGSGAERSLPAAVEKLKLPQPPDLSERLVARLALPGSHRERLEGAAELLEVTARSPDTSAKVAAALLQSATTLRRGASLTAAILRVETGPARTTNVAIRLANPPTTRIRLSLDQLDEPDHRGGGHAELEWDPAVGSALVQRVDLGPGRWAASVSVEPTFIQQGEGTILIAAKFGELDQLGELITMRGTYTALVAGRAEPDAKQVPMTGWPRPELAFQCGAAALESIGKLELAPQVVARPSVQRSAGVAPAVVAETLSIIAEIAVERARSGAMALIKDRVVGPLCTGTNKVTLKQLGLGRDELAFPLTCNVLQSMRLEDVLSSGGALLRSLRDDARRTILPAAVGQLAPAAPAMRALLQGVLQAADRAIERGAFDGLEIGMVLDLLGSADLLISMVPEEKLQRPSDQLKSALQAALAIQGLFAAACQQGDSREACATRITSSDTTLRQWSNYYQTATRAAVEGERRGPLKALGDVLAPELKTLFTTKPELARAKDLVCRARLAIAVVKRCAGAACSAARITEILAHPESSFAKDTEFPATLCWEEGAYARTPEDLAWVQRLVLDGLALVQPARQATAREQAAGVIRLVAAVTSKMDPRSSAAVQRFTDLVVGLLEERYDAVLTGMFELAAQLAGTRTIPGLRKLAALGGAVATYVSVYNSTKESDAAAAREARKKSLESLIDSATDRHDREHSWIVSLGSNVGAGWTYTTKRQDDGKSEGGIAVRVPFGVALQYLPAAGRRTERGELQWHRWLGVHAGLQLFDLGQFVRSDDADVKWSSFVAPGVELGALIGTPSSAFSIAVHGAYAPALTDDSTRGAWRVGFSIGYYVPFFDLN